MQLALQDHDRSCRHTDFLHIEDLDPDYSHVNYELLRQKITEFNPDLLCTFRNHFEDRTLGSKLNGSMRYLIEQPEAIHCIKMVPTVRQSSKDKSVLDQDSVQLEWIEHVLELFDDYITGKYNVPLCVGLFLYEDLAEIAFNNLEASGVSVSDASAMGQCVNTSSTTRLRPIKRPFAEVSTTSSDPIKKDSLEVAALSKGQFASTQVTTEEPQCGDEWQHPLHTFALPQPEATCSIATATSGSSKRQRIDDLSPISFNLLKKIIILCVYIFIFFFYFVYYSLHYFFLKCSLSKILLVAYKIFYVHL